MPDLLLDARGLRKTFASGRGAGRRVVHAVQDVDLAIERGQTHGLVGGSGSGKSTTARLLLRLVEPDAGSALFRGVDLFTLRGEELRRMRRHIQLIYQDPASALDPRFSARDIVAEPWAIHGLYDAAGRRRRADELLARVGIDPALVVKTALVNAASVAGLMLTTNVLVSELKEETEAATGAVS